MKSSETIASSSLPQDLPDAKEAENNLFTAKEKPYRPTPQGFCNARKLAKQKRKQEALAAKALGDEKSAAKKIALTRLLSDPGIASATTVCGRSGFVVDLRQLTPEQKQAVADYALEAF